MARTIETKFIDSVQCAECGTQKSELEVLEFASENRGEQGDKHMEIYECPNCGTSGSMGFTPPTDMYTLKGPLFGEDEDPDDLESEVSQLG